MSTTSAAELLTIDQVAGRVHRHPQTVRKWIRDGLIGHVRLTERGLYVSEDQLAAFIDAHRIDAES